MVLIGWMMRAIILGAKFDECRRCSVPGPHLLLRKTHWFTIFRIPVVLLWISHGILCPECGDIEGIGFLAMRRALRDGRLPLGRARPRFEALARERLGGVDPADWRTFGLEPGRSEDEVRARWRQLAKQLHPDAGGDPAAFVRMQAVYQRLLATPGVTVTSAPDPAEVFDPVIKNPKRGPFDLYTKAWPFLAAGVFVVGMMQPSTTGTVGGSGGSGTPTGPAPVTTGTAHQCWATGSTLNGCRDDTTTTMLFGEQVGRSVTCWFVEPLNYQSASCR